jgi:hypothetical protein
MAHCLRKQFFFEKKNQKTLACLKLPAADGVIAQANGKNFLFLFFKKEILPSLTEKPGQEPRPDVSA